MAKNFTAMTVLRTEWLTDHLIRVWFGGDGFDGFVPAGPGAAQGRPDTDMYVKFVFPPAGVEYPRPFDMERIAAEFGPEQQPVLRTYTVRRYDPAARELAVDFVVHGDEGIAGPWAARVAPGEEIVFRGPGSGYRPDPAAPWHLLVSDEAGLPALAAALEALPAEAIAKVFIHGEAQAVMKNLRPYVRKERGVGAKRAASISGYWRRGRTEEGFRQWKAEQRAAGD